MAFESLSIDRNMILITGCAGFIGEALTVRLLQTTSARILGIDNMNDYYDVHLKKERLNIIRREDTHRRFSFEIGDISDKKMLFMLFEKYKPSVVVHLAAQAGVRYSIENPDTYIQSNIIGFYNILEACRASQELCGQCVKHLLFASSSSVYGNNEKVPYSEEDRTDFPVSLYAATKKADEIMAYSYAKLYGIPMTGVRFFTVYGPMGRPDMACYKFADKILSGEKIKLYNYGKNRRDFTYIDDVIQAMLAILSGVEEIDTQSDVYRIFNIGSHRPVFVNDFLEELIAVLKAEGMVSASYDLKEHVEYIEAQPGDVDVTYADISKLSHTYGNVPSTSLKAGLASFARWYCKYRSHEVATHVPPQRIASREDSFTTFAYSPQQNTLFCLLHNGFMMKIDCNDFTSEYIFLDYDYLSLKQFLAYQSIYIDGCVYYFAYNEKKYLCFDTRNNVIFMQEYQTMRNIGETDKSLIMDLQCCDGYIYCFSRSGEVLKIDTSLKKVMSIIDIGTPVGDGEACFFKGEEFIFFENSDIVKIFDFSSNTVREQGLGFQISSLQSAYADNEFIYLLSKNGEVRKLRLDGFEEKYNLKDECSIIVVAAGTIWVFPKLEDNIYYIQKGMVGIYAGYSNDFCYIAPKNWLLKSWKYVNFVETENFIILPMRIGNRLVLLSKDNGELYWHAIQMPSSSEELRMRYRVNDMYVVEGGRFDLESFISSL